MSDLPYRPDEPTHASVMFHAYGGRHAPYCALCSETDDILGKPEKPWVVNNPDTAADFSVRRWKDRPSDG